FVTDDLRQDLALDWLRENITVELVPEGTLEPEEEVETEEVEAEESIVEESIVEESIVEVEAEEVPDESE
ncbi:MAG: trigger factor, partial [Spirulina sp.]